MFINKRKSSNKKRIKNIIIFFITMFLGLIIRMSWLILINGKEYATMALEQWTSESKIYGTRGNVLDRNGNTLVLSVNVYRIDLNLQLVLDYAKRNNISLEEVAKTLSQPLDLTTDYILKRLNLTDSDGTVLKSVSLVRGIEKDQANELKSLNIDGVTVSSDIKRYYPNNNFASHVLGNINSEGTGLNGIELNYNSVLTGISGISISETNGKGEQLAYSEFKYTEPVDGKDIILTIDGKIQFFAEEVAEQAYLDHNPDSVTIVVMNPNNGEILAMVNKPDFDPNNSFANYEKFKGETDNDKLQNMWKNNAISNTIEPGSIFKIITAAIAIEENIAGNNEKYYCSGSLTIDNTTIRCWKGPEDGGHGLISIEEALETSCNVAFMEIASKIGRETFNKYIEGFDLNQLSGIDLPGEIKGIIKSTVDMDQVDLATISFGQTNTINVMQYMKALNSIANSGNLIQPHIMKEISYIDSTGKRIVEESFEPNVKKCPVSQETIDKLKIMLESTVRLGSSKNAYVKDYAIAGKTGTAEKINKATGAYDEESGYVSSFAGFAPYDNPEISLIILIDNPKNGEYFGGVVAAPYANTLFNNILNYLESTK